VDRDTYFSLLSNSKNNKYCLLQRINSILVQYSFHQTPLLHDWNDIVFNPFKMVIITLTFSYRLCSQRDAALVQFQYGWLQFKFKFCYTFLCQVTYVYAAPPHCQSLYAPTRFSNLHANTTHTHNTRAVVQPHCSGITHVYIFRIYVAF
jgi:hypothetical protein